MDRKSDSSEVLNRYCDPLYEQAGELVEEEENQISLTRFSHLLNDEVAGILEKVLVENPLPFPLQDFQKIALHAIGSLKKGSNPRWRRQPEIKLLTFLTLQSKIVHLIILTLF